ncbi:growth-regulating factor 9 isoform X1 [Arachis duranensis]|uniref:Growth-regulating factor n=1 Tax=Arachis duranensis TaxID=130453 RepID=A0A6P4CGD5_ARADU|nr:growth-regulating factor 9 isoform X1 [Arachis duranensis]
MNVTMEAKSLEAVPSSHNTSGGPQKKIDMGQKMDGGGGVGVIKEEKKNTTSFETLKRAEEEEGGTIRKPAMNKAWQQQEEDRCCCLLFTEAQRRELHHQVLTFNYFAYNLPLPLPLPHPHHHLVLPFGSGFGVFHKQFPSYMSGEYNHYQCFDYGSMMDPEPNRCRRTDGKKWRCSKNTVPYHKYCERHVHRGRNRSRKPVETSKVVNSNSITKPCSKPHTTIASNTKSAVSIPTPKVTNFGNMTSVASDNRSSRDLCKKDNQIKNCVGYSISVMSSGKGSVTNDSNCISAGIGFSPRSVLQVSGCNSSHHNYTNSTELEPGRCRRTDGKKWRCKSAVLPGQKYCTTHVHRGAKRRCSIDHEPVTTPTPTPRYANTNSRPIYSAANRTTITEARKTVCTVPNTKLSMSIPASAPLRHNNGKSPNRSSDTDTTITDTINECSYASF